MKRSTHLIRVAALTGALALVLAACAGTDEGDEAATSDATETEGEAMADGPMKIGSVLPLTGSLAFLGPPEVAGVNLAIQEINDAGGVLGNPVEVIHADSSDADNAEVATQSVQDLLSQDVTTIIGAASSSVTRNIVDDITNAEVVQISPANTATDLSGRDPFYFRTAPSDLLQGDALGNLIVADGNVNVAFIVFNEDYGTSLRDVAEKTIEDAGGTVTYGKAGEEFDPKETSYKTIVGNALATNPDAISIIAFEQTKLIIPELVTAGFDMSKLYFVDGNLSNYGEEFDPGTLEGAKGTLPGAFPDDAFQARLAEVDPELQDFSYAAESYDATILAALAAIKGGGVDGPTIQANLAAVSGADGGEAVSTFADAVAAIEAGSDVDWEAVSGAGPFNADNDPSSAFIGVYEFGADNTYTWVSKVFGEL